MGINGGRLPGMIVAGAVALALTACGAGDDDGAPDSTGRTADASKAKTLVLDGDAFPAGFELLDVPTDQVVELAKMSDATSGAAVTPASCGGSGVIPADASPDSFGIAAAAKGSEGTLIEVVSALERSIADYRAAVTGECSTISTTIASGPMAGLKATVKTTVVDAPKTAAGDAVLVYQQDSTAKSGGQTTRTRSLTGVATVKGYVVRVQYSPMITGLEVNRTVFDDTFAAAVEKVSRDG